MKKVKISTLGNLVKANEQTEKYIQFISTPYSWHRIGLVESTVLGGGILNILNTSANIGGRFIILSMSHGHMRKIDSSVNILITKGRFINEDSKRYIEIYYDHDISTTMKVIALGYHGIALLDNVIPGNDPSGAGPEFSFT